MKKITILLFSALPLFWSCKDKKISLHMLPEIGSEYVIETNSNQTASMVLYGQEVVFEQKIKLEHHFSVDSIFADSSMSMTGHLSKVYMEIIPVTNKGIVTSFTFDSENSENNKGNYKAYSYIFNKFIEKPYILKIGKHGDVISNSKSTLISEMGLDTLQESKNALEDDFTTLFAVLPLESISEGSVYTRNIVSGTETKVDWVNEYLVEKISDTEVILNLNGNISNSDNSGAGNDFKGSQSGNIVVDRKTGMVTNSEIDLQLEVISKDEAALQPKINGKVTYVCKKIK